MTYEQKWNELKNHIDERMAKVRHAGKFQKENEVLWNLKRKMQDLDPSIENVGETFDKHETEGHDVKGDK